MRSGALRIVVIYIIAALIWIMLSDRLLFLFQGVLNPRVFLAINSGKGFAFVIITSYFLYKLIKAEEIKLVESSRRSLKADD
ncbi:MAG TPA: hypothetical protein VHS53_14240, partial [Mucilaginibacter sp.]|nr:hypothetical protein [Mucilaginibacter sp.]